MEQQQKESSVPFRGRSLVEQHSFFHSVSGNVSVTRQNVHCTVLFQHSALMLR